MEQIDTKEWGTFKDSLKVPVFGWFTYPAGFSYKAVEYSFQEEGIKAGSTIYDPFMGSGTTNIVAQMMGINSYGVEAHPFIYPIAKCKINWKIDTDAVLYALAQIERLIMERDVLSDDQERAILEQEFPELIRKCFLSSTLYELLLIRNEIRHFYDEDVKLFLNTGLICCLRSVSIAATGWPYIAPNKIKITSFSKKGWETFDKFVKKMVDDIKIFRSQYANSSIHKIYLGDSRDTTKYIQDSIIDHIFTSPPYLNNFDYADRTRLEMYFMGDAHNWSDICTKVRTKLMTSATTQINRNDSKYVFSNEFINKNPQEYNILRDSVLELTELRKTKGGKKSYDLLVVGYFNDMFNILQDNFRVLKKGHTAKYILGDSAPYGVHIPTDELIGRIGCNIGFKDYKIDLLRSRGDKWKNNPQRHNVKLRETIVTLIK